MGITEQEKTGKSGSTLKLLMIYWVQDHLQSQKY